MSFSFSPCEIRSDHLIASFDPVAGGRLSRLQWRRPCGDLFDVVVPMTTGLQETRWPKAGAYPLIPYSNRIANGRLLFRGAEYTLAPHPDARPHTLHGGAHLLPWQYRIATGSHIALEVSCQASPAWPWSFLAKQCFTVSANKLKLEMAVRNMDGTAMPIGLGWHPFFRCEGAVSLHHTARERWPHDERFLPVGRVEAPGPDWGSPVRLEPHARDAYLGNWGQAFELRYHAGVRIRLTASPIFEHLVVHRPAGGSYVCVEPTTHVTDGFNLAAAGVPGTGLRVLEPGEELCGSLQLEFSETRRRTNLADPRTEVGP